jgi:hypothetical protein
MSAVMKVSRDVEDRNENVTVATLAVASKMPSTSRCADPLAAG